jgi:alkyl sulfatase BDS1-like metallo-beta-lactamase superfamily hydrolase
VIEDAGADVRTNQTTIIALNIGKTTVAEATAAGDLEVSGDAAIIEKLFAMLDNFDLMFDVVAPSWKKA